jgi:hypothetical protein
MTVSGISSKTGSHLQMGRSAARVASQAEPITSGALVPVERPVWSPPARTARPDASFVAHLIAMAEQDPQTRTLRRATPSVARGAYTRITMRGANDHGKVLSQTA